MLILAIQMQAHEDLCLYANTLTDYTQILEALTEYPEQVDQILECVKEIRTSVPSIALRSLFAFPNLTRVDRVIAVGSLEEIRTLAMHPKLTQISLQLMGVGLDYALQAYLEAYRTPVKFRGIIYPGRDPNSLYLRLISGGAVVEIEKGELRTTTLQVVVSLGTNYPIVSIVGPLGNYGDSEASFYDYIVSESALMQIPGNSLETLIFQGRRDITQVGIHFTDFVGRNLRLFNSILLSSISYPNLFRLDVPFYISLQNMRYVLAMLRHKFPAVTTFEFFTDSDDPSFWQNISLATGDLSFRILELPNQNLYRPPLLSKGDVESVELVRLYPDLSTLDIRIGDRV